MAFEPSTDIFDPREPGRVLFGRKDFFGGMAGQRGVDSWFPHGGWERHSGEGLFVAGMGLAMQPYEIRRIRRIRCRGKGFFDP